MNGLKKTLATGRMMRLLPVAVAALLAASPLASIAADWNSTEVQYLHGSKFNDNGVTPGAPKFSKDIITLQHASGYSLGRNFFFVDFSKSDAKDANLGEVYGEYYHTFSGTRLVGVDWSKSFLRDIGITAGINYGAKNGAFGANPRVLLIGPTFEFNVPGAAFFNVDVLAYQDSGRFSGFGGGYLCGSQKTTYQITPSWLVPFNVGSAKFEFTGFVDRIGAHGTCAAQTLTQPQLRWDIGNHFGRPGKLMAGIEWQLWRNKFGNRGVNESVPQLLLVYKM